MKILDLFCGAGGFSLGFENVGFESILAIDMWKDAILTYNHNRKHKVGINIDIHDYSDEMLQNLSRDNDVAGIIGGPPCQGFSLVGKREASDERNSLYLEYVRFVSVTMPKFLVLENVKGLLSLEKGKYKDDIIERFDNLGYNISMKILRASEYGVPQSRERVFFIGLRRDIFNNTFFDFELIEKAKTVTTKDALSDLPNLDRYDEPSYYPIPPLNEYQHMMRKKSNKVLNHDVTNHTQQTIDIIKMVPDGGSIRDLSDEFYSIRNYSSAFKRMDSEKPSGTIDCGHRNYFHYSENRVPTVRESARIQSFPDDYEFLGSKTSQYTQVGNAVPVLLAKKIAYVLKKYLEEV